jgi:hypothetical protein
MGGRLTFLVAGADERVKAAASVYGAVSMQEPLRGIPGSEQVRFKPGEGETWRAVLDAESYAPRIRCPFLYLSASNDFYGAMDFVDRALARIPHSKHWQTFSPHFNHHVAAEQSAALPIWMDRWLKNGPGWPRSPEIRLVSGETPVARVSAGAERARSVAIYYSIDPYPQSRFWRSAVVSAEGSQWRARLPLTSVANGLWAFANVVYESGLSLSTRVASLGPEALTRAGVRESDSPTLLIDDFANGARDWYAPLASPNLLLGDRRWFQSGGAGLAPDPAQGASWRMATRKIGDPKWKGPPGAALRIRVHTARQNTMIVAVTENEFRRPKETRTYLARLALPAGEQALSLPLSEFRDVANGRLLASWDEINVLALQAQYTVRASPRDPTKDRIIGETWQGPPPTFSRLEWVPKREE